MSTESRKQIRRYLAKAKIKHTDLFLKLIGQCGLTVVIEDEKMYHLGPKCEKEQRFFAQGCLRLWTIAEVAGVIKPPATPPEFPPDNPTQPISEQNLPN